MSLRSAENSTRVPSELSMRRAVRSRHWRDRLRPRFASRHLQVGAGEVPPSGMRGLGGAFVLLLALAAPADAQVGFDRPGGDYANFVVGFGDPALCASRCDRDARCRAWSFSY